MLDKELTSVQDGRRRGYGHHLPHHNVGKPGSLLAEDKPARRYHALQAALLVCDVEVNDPSSRRVLAQPLQRLARLLAHQKARKVLVHVLGDEVV